MDSFFAFAPEIRFFRESRFDIDRRLHAHLERLRGPRARQLSDRLADDPAEQRISRRARLLHEARTRASGLGHLRAEVSDRLRPLAAGVRLVGPATEHAADEIAAALFAEAPWLGRAIDALWRDMRAGAREGVGLRLRPTLLDGPPGVGKSWLALRLGPASGWPRPRATVA